MKLAHLLLERRIIVDLKATNKIEAVREMIASLQKEGVPGDFDAIFNAVIEREEIENTSYGHGFAFPHARTDAVSEMFVVIGISKKGLNDKTADNLPLHVICLLLTPSTIAKLYLQALSGLANFARKPGTMQKVLGVKSPTDLIELVTASAINIDKDLMVRDVMRYDVATVTADDSLKEVANRMFRHKLSALAVVGPKQNLIGVITDRDLIRAALPDYKSLIQNLNYSLEVEPFEELLKQQDKIRVSQLYDTKFETATPDTRIVEVAAMMIFKDLRRVFVVEGEKLVGVLLRKDIVNMIIRG